MSFSPPAIAAYNYNANPPQDDGSRTASNRVSWAKIRTSLTDPLRSWIDSINSEIARTFSEVSEFYVPVGAVIHVAWSGAGGGYAGLNILLSQTDYARLYSAIGGYWTYSTIPAGQFLTPPFNYYMRSSGVTGVGTLQADQNQAHIHEIVDPGHAHTLPTQWAAGSRDVAGSNLSTIATTSTSANTGASPTGIFILASGASEARPVSMILQGMIKT